MRSEPSTNDSCFTYLTAEAAANRIIINSKSTTVIATTNEQTV
jgi:hypothetical protein